MRIQTRSAGRARTFAWLVALMSLVFATSACGETSTNPEQSPDAAPPANASEENAPADGQGGDQADYQGDDGQGGNQADDSNDDQADDQSDDSSDDQADDQDDN